MDDKQFDWKTGFKQLFAATVNQQTFEEAAELMVSVSSKDSSYHKECIFVFDQALQSVNAEDDFVVSCINKSGYRVSNLEEADELLQEFRDIYLQEYQRVTNGA